MECITYKAAPSPKYILPTDQLAGVISDVMVVAGREW